ncbi:MAG TPA: efflux RND transporter permease subunit [Candidatus Latescibacteria bacterium]|nr:efflux RND transporter permease subunit [Candidatus Latescibacterota bacterium]
MHKLGMAGNIAAFFINSKLTPLVVIASLLLGTFAVVMTPREEEPQIVVPMIDVFVKAPGLTAKEVEQRVTNPMEELLWEVSGVEYIYSTSRPGMSMVIVRFLVGEDEEDSILKTYNKLYANFDKIPAGVSRPLIKSRSIDDVPIMGLTFWSDDYDGFMLRRIAAEVEDAVKEIGDVSETQLIGGLRRQVRVELFPDRLAGYGVSPSQVMQVLQGANMQLFSGRIAEYNRDVLIETGSFLESAEDVGSVVVSARGGRPVYLRDVAQIMDGPEEPVNYVRFGAGPAFGAKVQGSHPAVTLSVAKRKGTNAIDIASLVLAKVEALKGRVIPGDVEVTITRNYGKTATEKSDELLFHMGLATISVIVLIWFALGLRESGVVGVAIPVTLGLTLFVFYIYGYTLNRITLFALIFSIGILVDDAIVVVENIVRHFRLPENEDRPLPQVVIEAVDEVGNPTILATLAVIAAILPMAFVGGLMGPYMKPIPVGASAAMIFSLLVAFIVTPWAALRLLKRSGYGDHGDDGEHGDGNDWTTRICRKAMGPLVSFGKVRAVFLVGMVGLLVMAMALVGIKFVVVKMLPFDNKSEFQVMVNTPEGTTLETTAALALEMGAYLGTVPEVTDYQVYAGTSGPFNFNGLVRHYFLRQGPNVADIQVNLTPKHDRDAQSHDVAKRVRPYLVEMAERYGAQIEVAEVPPGPPVLQTLVAEIYGPDYERQIEVAEQIRAVFAETEGVVDVDSYTEAVQPKYRFVVDKEKAALNGISTQAVAELVKIAIGGMSAGLVHVPDEAEDLEVVLRLPLVDRSNVDELMEVEVPSPAGTMVPLGELVWVEETQSERSIYHKNLMPVVYVTADVGGRFESPVYAVQKLGAAIDELALPEGYGIEQFTAQQPFTQEKIAMKWGGEWHITYEVFRDLGIAFGAVLVLIYILLVAWFQSFLTPLVIMAAIPFSLVGIMPAHGGLDAFFTATSMIGFIAGAGIVVRNSIILVDFIELRVSQGMELSEAVIDAGAVRFRPMLLTAAAVIVGASVILFDPIFQGLAISLMAGEVASLLLSRMAVPVLYHMMAKRQETTVQLAN